MGAHAGDGQELPAAPQPETAGAKVARGVTCPFCRSKDVEPMAMFGAQLMTEQFYCRACHTPFEHLRDAGDVGAPGER